MQETLLIFYAFKKIGGVNHEKEFYDFLNSSC